MEKFTRLWGIKLASGAPYSPWSNGANERNHASCDRILKRLIAESPREDLQTLVNQAAWVHNSNLSQNGGVPITIMMGNKPRFPVMNKNENDSEKLDDIEDQIDIVRNIQKDFS